jgi:predicted acylesterase/phospholipase RssA
MSPVQAKRKTALVLAGGGLAGAVYEIGALRAIDDLLVDRTVNDFDIYVGTSAGAFIGSMLANGINPETMLSVIEGSHPELRALRRRDLFSFNHGQLWRRSAQIPRKITAAWFHYLRHIRDMSLFDFFFSLGEILPAGLYDSLALEEYVRHNLLKANRNNRFDGADRDLFIIATDLDTGERAVFSAETSPDVPISLAVAASSAVPLFYRPTRVGDHEYVDGGLRGTASLDLAIEQGASLVICINPLVPFDNSSLEKIPFLGPDGGYLSEKGMQAIMAQATRIVLHAGLHYHIKQLRRSHPDVDIILIEPRADDYQMFFYNIMRYSTRLKVAQHGFESVTLDLAEDYPRYKETLARHGVAISRRRVIEELHQLQQSDFDPDVVRHLLETRPFSNGRSHNSIGNLQETLAELEELLAVSD